MISVIIQNKLFHLAWDNTHFLIFSLAFEKVHVHYVTEVTFSPMSLHLEIVAIFF